MHMEGLGNVRFYFSCTDSIKPSLLISILNAGIRKNPFSDYFV